MSLEEQVKQIVEGAFETDDLFLVHISISKSNLKSKISVFIDSDTGITIDQCGAVSRQIGEPLDSLFNGAYTLEVSSPGIDFPLKTERQYRKNIGRNLKVDKTDKSQIKGKLIGLDKDKIIIEEKKKKETIVHELPFDNIKEAKVQVTF